MYLTTTQTYRLFKKHIPALGRKRIIDWCEAGHIKCDFPGIKGGSPKYRIRLMDLYLFVRDVLDGVNHHAKMNLLAELRLMLDGKTQLPKKQESFPSRQLRLFVGY